MKSFKPGRGPSRQSFVSCIAAALFGVFWTVGALAITRGFGLMGIIFPMFGLVFVGIAIYNAIYYYKNATSENRNSMFDIVDEDEEPDPLNQKYGAKKEDKERSFESNGSEKRFCPYCGEKTNGTDKFCRNCGHQLEK